MSRRVPVLIAAGSNIEPRLYRLRRAVSLLRPFVDVVRVSSVFQTDPQSCPPGASEFLNLVIAGTCRLSPFALLHELLELEKAEGRRRPAPLNSPRTLDLDLILYGAQIVRTPDLRVPHPRFAEREFVLAPTRELRLRWTDPRTGLEIAKMRGSGAVRRLRDLTLQAGGAAR